MALTAHELEFLGKNHSAAMITVGDDGYAKVARVGVFLMDGRLWSSGTQARTRTERLRRDPRCTLYVHESQFAFLALETTVTIKDGPDAPDESVRLFRLMQGKPTGPLSWFGGELTEAEFRQTMIDEQRLIYEFEVHRAYGLN